MDDEYYSKFLLDQRFIFFAQSSRKEYGSRNILRVPYRGQNFIPTAIPNRNVMRKCITLIGKWEEMPLIVKPLLFDDHFSVNSFTLGFHDLHESFKVIKKKPLKLSKC